MTLNLELAPVLLALAHLLVGWLVLVTAKLAKDWLSPYQLNHELTSKDNQAFGLAIAGYYIAVFAIYLGATRGQPLPLDAGAAGVGQAIGLDLAWSMAGILALNASRYVMDRSLLASCCNSEQIIRHRNLASGAVEGCGYIATSLVLSGAMRETGGSVWTAAAFFVLSQLVLILFGRFYQWWVDYGVSEQVIAGNLAAGAAFGLTLVAISILMLKATSGEFVDWPTNLSYFAFDAVAGFLLLLALRWVTDAALLPDACIVEENSRDRNVNVGLLEGVLATGNATLIFFLF